MTFTVGDKAQNEVMFYWDQFWGRLLITVNGQSVIDVVRVFSISLS